MSKTKQPRLIIDGLTVLRAYERSRQRKEMIRIIQARGYTVKTLVTRKTMRGLSMDYIIIDDPIKEASND